VFLPNPASDGQTPRWRAGKAEGRPILGRSRRFRHRRGGMGWVGSSLVVFRLHTDGTSQRRSHSWPSRPDRRQKFYRTVCWINRLRLSLVEQTNSISCNVACGEPNVFSKFSPSSLLAPPHCAQLASRQALGGFRCSLFRALSHLAREPSASSTTTEAVSDGLWPDSLHLVTSRAAWRTASSVAGEAAAGNP
jgi:hypothetical protein